MSPPPGWADADALLALAGRVFIAVIFLASGFGKITNFEGTVKYMEAQSIPLAAPLCAAAIVLEIAGGLSLVLGWNAKWGAAALVIFLVPTTVVFHIGADQRIHFLKNIAIMGGLLQVAAFGPGRLSLDERPRDL